MLNITICEILHNLPKDQKQGQENKKKNKNNFQEILDKCLESDIIELSKVVNKSPLKNN